MERRIGEVFWFKGKRYKVIKSYFSKLEHNVSKTKQYNYGKRIKYSKDFN